MGDQPKTRRSLLARIRDKRDGEAWSQFVAIYSPLVYRFVRRRGLQATDAADVTQEVFRAVAAGIRRFDYDRRQGSFRGWLITVARSKLHKFLRKRQTGMEGSGGTAVLKRLEQHASREDEDAFVEEEYQRCLFHWAAEQVRGDFQESTWQGFWRTSVKGETTNEVADCLGMTVGAVYIARSRVLARLKEKIQQAEG